MKCFSANSAPHSLGKPVTLVVNKCEGVDPETAGGEFFALGLGRPLPVSAAHSEGLEALMQRVLAIGPVSGATWLVLGATALSLLVVMELQKIARRWRARRQDRRA